MAKLYIVATPIGNLSDISLRALEVFKSVDIIFCEDTRVTRKLLKHYNIDKPLISYHQHSPKSVSRKVMKTLESGQDLALVSDAGTPGIQDPGNKLISELVNQLIRDKKDTIDQLTSQLVNLQIIPIPGPSALTALASVSGLPTDSFLFLGFLPKKKGRRKLLQEIMNSSRTVIFYESGHRILKTLEELSQLTNQLVNQSTDRKVVVGRELTKKFETIYRGTIGEVINQLNKSSTKGEFVVVVEGK